MIPSIIRILDCTYSTKEAFYMQFHCHPHSCPFYFIFSNILAPNTSPLKEFSHLLVVNQYFYFNHL